MLIVDAFALLFIIFPEINFRAKSKSRLKVGLSSEP